MVSNIFTPLLLLLAAVLLTSAHAGSPLEISTLTLRPTSRAPSTCNCAKSKLGRSGTCYYFPRKRSTKCKTRTCEASYVCKSVYTGMTCIRRRATSKIVADTPGRCKKVSISEYQWVLYNSRGPSGPPVLPPVPPKPPKTPPFLKPKVRNVRGVFLVVANSKVVKKCKFLYAARKVLRRYKTGSRCVFQVKKEGVVKNPRKIAGVPQTRKYGFNSKWKNARDLNHLRVIAIEYYRRSIYGINEPPATTKPPSPRGIFLVVAGKRVVGRFTVLSHAKRKLAVYGNSRKIRCMFEVKNGLVLKSYSKIAGQYQSKGRRAGFNKYWRNTKDIRRMYGIAKRYYKKYLIQMRSKNTRKRAKYIVVAGHSVIGYFMKLSKAKKALRRFRAGSKSPSRCIFQIKKGRVKKSAKIIGGQNQNRGLPRFNKYWKNGKDIKRMHAIAQKYATKHNLY